MNTFEAKTYKSPTGWYYVHSEHNFVTVYDPDEQMRDAFFITQYDYEEEYQTNGRPYPEEYVKECIDNYRKKHGR